MVDHHSVCCMCGDIGFPDKLFRCNKCRNRLQHSYCSNYYRESTERIEVCDWCQCEGKISSRLSHGSSSKKSAPATDGNTGGVAMNNRSEYSAGDKIKLQSHDRDGGSPADHQKTKGSGGGSMPSPRPTTRRYKLLKDVMC